MGGVIFMFSFLRVPNISLSNREMTPTPTLDNLPHLIMLEPTTVRREITKTTISASSTAKPSLTPTQISMSSTPTPLILFNKQQLAIDTIGYSLEGKPLRVYIFGRGEHERMIVADIHGGDEWNTLTFANQLIQYLNAHPTVVPDDITLYILPTLNPDGEARAHDKYGRLNSNGVDLNRNFPVNWQADWDRASCWNYLPSSGGSGPGSEVETKALMNFIEGHKIEALISYHSSALGIFPGGSPWNENSVQLAKSIAQVSNYRFPPLDIGCKYSGTLPDYAVSQGIAAVDLELTNHIETDFDMNLKVLDVLLSFTL